MNINNAIKKAKKLKLFPDGVYSPSYVDSVWTTLVSDRSSGKTTAWLIVGLIAYVDENVVTHYVRSREQMIRESNISGIYSVICEKGYISKITNDEFNTIIYQSRKRGFYLAYKNADGIIEKIDCDMCCKVMSIDNNDSYKSSYQCDTADFVIFDEFINIYYKSGEFVTFCDLLSTLFRKRLGAYIIMLANTINRRSEYFDELGCRDFIETAEQGDKITYNVDGTSVHVEVLGVKLNEQRKKFNSRYFNFNNKRLASIKGTGWSVDNVQHITRRPEEYLVKNIFVHYQTNYVQLYIVRDEKIGVCVHATKSNEPQKNDAIIYSIDDDFTNPIYKFGKGCDNFSSFLWSDLKKQNKWFYANNTVGSLIKAYDDACLRTRL